jgi:hypothetical protein
MKVYKERHMKYDFNIESEYVFRKGPQKGKVYNGPIIIYRNRMFGGEKMTAEVEKKWEIMPRPSKSKQNDASYETDFEHMIYDGLKKQYAKKFNFPRAYQHVLTEKDIEKGEYTRFFVEREDEVFEVPKTIYDYYLGMGTAYHKALKMAEIKMKLDVMSVDVNAAAISEAAFIIEGILSYVSPHDYMETVQFLYTAGDQLQYEDGANYIGEYHIHPQQGPMEGPVHLSTSHKQLYWSELGKYRPKDLV